MFSLSRCVHDPDASIGVPVCAHTPEYFSFLKERSHVPLALIAAAYLAFIMLRIDFGCYTRVARLFTCALVAIGAWLLVVAWETALVFKIVGASAWSPAFAWLAVPTCVATGLALGLAVDAAWRIEARLHLFGSLSDALWALAHFLVALGACAALLSMVAWARWAGGALALVALGAPLAAHSGVPALGALVIMWLAGARLYGPSPYVSAFAAAGAAALLVGLVAFTRWARARRCVPNSCYGAMQRACVCTT